jgi:hypothetical protein
VSSRDRDDRARRDADRRSRKGSRWR